MQDRYKVASHVRSVRNMMVSLDRFCGPVFRQVLTAFAVTFLALPVGMHWSVDVSAFQEGFRVIARHTVIGKRPVLLGSMLLTSNRINVTSCLRRAGDLDVETSLVVLGLLRTLRSSLRTPVRTSNLCGGLLGQCARESRFVFPRPPLQLIVLFFALNPSLLHVSNLHLAVALVHGLRPDTRFVVQSAACLICSAGSGKDVAAGTVDGAKDFGHALAIFDSESLKADQAMIFDEADESFVESIPFSRCATNTSCLFSR